ncbi:hypothetical protein D3C71_1586070 [compost metagenome]
MPGEIRPRDTLVDLGVDPRNEICICPRQFRCKQVQAQRQIGARFSREKIDYRVFPIGQRVARPAANIGIVGGQLPAAFLAYQPEAVDDGIQKAALTLGALPQNQCIQLLTPGKIEPFETITIAASAKVPVIACQND